MFCWRVFVGNSGQWRKESFMRFCPVLLETAPTDLVVSNRGRDLEIRLILKSRDSEIPPTEELSCLTLSVQPFDRKME